MLRRMLMYHILCQCPCAASSLWGPCAACHIYPKHFCRGEFRASKQQADEGKRDSEFPTPSVPAKISAGT
jgi:hypothetical protein